MIGTVLLGRYQVKALIGRGGMGNVYMARDQHTNEQIAVKHLKPEFVSDNSEIVERFRREAEILRELDHPNIVNIREAIFEDDSYFIIMDYIEGGSLDTLIAQHAPLSINRILEIGLGIADALTRAHHLKIIHRDIKPANILLDNNGVPLLTDFGVAHIGGRTRMTEVGSIIGTYAYLSPEACNGDEPDERADIWSFGVVLFELLTGRRPFLGDKPATIITQILVEDVPDIAELRPETPPGLIDLLERMLQKDPSDRISSVRRIGTELEEILQGTVVSPTKSRFNTPTPVNADEDRTIALPSPTPANVIPTTQTTPTSTTIVLQLNNVRTLGILVVAALIVVLAIVVVASGVNLSLTSEGENNTQSDGSQAASFEETPILNGDENVSQSDGFQAVSFEGAPIPTGHVLVMVAELEAVETAPRANTRFIADDLTQRLEQSNSNISVRIYPQVITNAEDAHAAAETNQAAIIVWGFYTADFIQIEIQVGSLAPFKYNQFERADLETMANLRTRITNVFDQSISYYVVSTLSTLYAADGDAFQSLLLSNFSQQQVISDDLSNLPRVLGDSIAAISVDAFYYFAIADDVDAGLQKFNTALQREPNPLLYIERSLAYLQIGDIDRARDDILSAQRLGPPNWTMPLYILVVIEEDNTNVVDTISDIIANRPDDWYAYTTRGSLYYFAGNYEAARTDLERAVSLTPPVNFPYTYLALIYIREGRFFDMVQTMQTIVRLFPDPDYNQRLLSSTFGASPLPYQDIVIAAVTNLSLGQYQAVLDTTEAFANGIDQALEQGLQGEISPAEISVFADLYFTRGLAYCNLGLYEAAEAAYTQSIELDDSYLMAYLSRLEVAHLQGNIRQAIADEAVLRDAVDMHPQLYEAILAAERGELSCTNFFSYQPTTATEPTS